MSCAGGSEPVFAKIQLVDTEKGDKREGPLLHATLFAADGRSVPHVAIYSHYFMNCRIASAPTDTPEGFEPAFEVWLAAGATPVVHKEPFEVFSAAKDAPRQ